MGLAYARPVRKGQSVYVHTLILFETDINHQYR